MPMNDFIPEGQDSAYESGQFQDFVPAKDEVKPVSEEKPVEVVVPKGGKPTKKKVTATQAKQLGAK